MQATEHRQPRSLDPRLHSGVMQPERTETYKVPEGFLNDVFQESREWRKEVQECRLEVGRVREAANTGTFFSGTGLGVIATLILVGIVILLRK